MPGAADVGTGQATGLPMLTVTPRRERLGDYGLDVAAVQETLRIAMAGVAVLNGVVIGGILSSTLLTLLVLPALYRLAYREATEH